jgi:YfiH family protein
MNYPQLKSNLLIHPKIQYGFLSNHTELFTKELLAKEPKICTVKQVHGKKLVWLEELEKRAQEADAIATRRANLAIGVHSADCAPLLVVGFQRGQPMAAMAIHAGWRGTAQQIAAHSFSEFHQNVQADHYQAIIGPCIQFSQFEVGAEVVAAFPLALERGLAKFQRKEGDKEKFLFDLPGENGRQLLEAAAAKNAKIELEIFPFCTFLEQESLPSFRRDREKAGRILSWIAFQS